MTNRYSVLLVANDISVLGKMSHWDLQDIKEWAYRRVKDLGENRECILYINDCFRNNRLVFEVREDVIIKRTEKQYDDTARFKGVL